MSVDRKYNDWPVAHRGSHASAPAQMSQAQPNLTAGCLIHLRKIMKSLKNPKVLEFGSGYSTVWFSNEFNCELISIEHNASWYNRISEMVQNNKNTTLIFKPSEPVSLSSDLLVDSYASECDEFEDEYFDIVLIDGRNRVDCFNHSERTLKKGGVMILDDSDRDEYSHVLEAYKDKITYPYAERLVNGVIFQETIACDPKDADLMTHLWIK